MVFMTSETMNKVQYIIFSSILSVWMARDYMVTRLFHPFNCLFFIFGYCEWKGVLAFDIPGLQSSVRMLVRMCVLFWLSLQSAVAAVRSLRFTLTAVGTLRLQTSSSFWDIGSFTMISEQRVRFDLFWFRSFLVLARLWDAHEHLQGLYDLLSFSFSLFVLRSIYITKGTHTE